MSTQISIQKVSKFYGTKQNPIKAVGPVDLEIEKGSYTLILGRSGSGKSTLLNLMSGLDKPSEGRLVVGQDELNKYNGKELAKYRSSIGIIFQFYNLLPNLNTLENVMMGGWAGGNDITKEEALSLLEKLGLSHRTKADVKTLSGGEKQRVAIARALTGNPEILFCDEPTGALDSASEIEVQKVLQDLNKNEGKTIVMVSHNPDFQNFADKIVYMKDGTIEKTENRRD
jgi:putative ABC transport system ATP-binding protein